MKFEIKWLTQFICHTVQK